MIVRVAQKQVMIVVVHVVVQYQLIVAEMAMVLLEPIALLLMGLQDILIVSYNVLMLLQ
jgi:hypothetical protein